MALGAQTIAFIITLNFVSSYICLLMWEFFWMEKMLKTLNQNG
uniref:Uncharacterized protein n=1 Tax=Rhizophora mucronata TaxID=61149 RepID=A0A2P2Q829_RHIMU